MSLMITPPYAINSNTARLTATTMEKKGSERACQPSLSILHLGLALLTGAVLVEVFFIHHLYMEVSLIKTELAVRAVGASDRPNGPSSDRLARGDIGNYAGND